MRQKDLVVRQIARRNLAVQLLVEVWKDQVGDSDEADLADVLECSQTKLRLFDAPELPEVDIRWRRMDVGRAAGVGLDAGIKGHVEVVRSAVAPGKPDASEHRA